MISAALLKGVMSCGRRVVLAEIKLKKEKRAGASDVELWRVISASTTSSLWLDMQNPLLLCTKY